MMSFIMNGGLVGMVLGPISAALTALAVGFILLVCFDHDFRSLMLLLAYFGVQK